MPGLMSEFGQVLADMVVKEPAVECGVAVQDLADSVSDMSKSNDWFLVAPDFTDYMRAQVSPRVWRSNPLRLLFVLR